MIYIELILNLSLLVALTVVSGFIEKRSPRRTILGAVMQGMLFGTAAILGMLHPVNLGPGLIFDGRSVMVSLCALFFGPWAAAIAGAMSILCRMALGSTGAFTGSLVILSSAVLGILYRFRFKPENNPPPLLHLYLFGLAVHAVMMALMFTLPGNAGLSVITRIGIPIMLLYPLATVLAGSILSDQVIAGQNLMNLTNSRERHKLEHERLDLILNKMSPDGFWLIETSTGRLIDVNDASCSMLGYSREELLNARLVDIEANMSPEEIDQQMQTIKDHGYSTYESRHRTKSGAIVDVDVRITCLESADQCFAFVRDITERKWAEKAILESELRWRLSIEYMLEAYALHEAIFDDDGRMVDYRFLEFNPAAQKIANVARENIVGRTARELYPFVEERGLLSRYADVMATGVPSVIEDFYYAGDNLDKALDISCFRLDDRHFVCVFRDITDRKRAEEALRASEEEHRMIIQTAMDGFWVTDLHSRILKVNAAYCRMSGYSEAELLTMSIADVEVVESRSDTTGHIQQIIGQGAERFETRHRRKDGTLFDVEVSVQYQPIEGGRLMAFMRDITSQKRADEERDKLQAQLAQAQKMESIGRLAGGVAHDFNNMLGVILGHTDMALQHIKPDDPLHDDLMDIQKSGQRSADLTRQLLAFARKQTVAPKVIDLNDTVAGMLKMLYRLIGEDINLAWKPGDELWPVKIDPAQIDQILANLCVNARDAIQGVGKITIETANKWFDEEYCLRNAGCMPGSYVMLAVSDNGCGMEADTLCHLFEPFFTTKEAGKGTGLGLATVYGSVKQNNGFINVYSEPGRGTTFKVYLPRHGDGTVRKIDQAPPRAEVRGKETILLVEDEPALLKMTARMIRNLGYTVLTAHTPGEAISIAREYPARIDLLLTDVVLPEMNGRDLAGNLLPICPGMARLFMSGYTANVIAHHGVLDPGVHFIQKPFTLSDLGAKIREAMD